jgi:hypothetical protein
LLIALLVWVSVFGRGFWTLANVQNLVIALSVEGVMVMGMTIVMIGAGFDLSIGSVMAMSGVIVVEALPLGKPVAIVLALIISSAVGLANGTLISGLRLNPFIATLGTMVVVSWPGDDLHECPTNPGDGPDLHVTGTRHRIRRLSVARVDFRRSPCPDPSVAHLSQDWS